jgi:lysophospholipase L1-like esterase
MQGVLRSPQTQIKVIVLFLGANDAVTKANEKSPHVKPIPVERYTENLKAIMSHLRAVSPHSKLVLVTPPPVGIDQVPDDRDAEYVRKYRDACINVGKEAEEGSEWGWDVVTVDTWELFLGPEKCEEPYTEKQIHDYLVDGLHFDMAGNYVVGNAIAFEIQQRKWVF